MKTREIIKRTIERVLENMNVKGRTLDIGVEHPADEKMGDYSSNIALETGLDAEEIKNELEKNKKLMKIVDKIETAGPGFINFYLKKKFLLGEMTKAIEEKDSYGRGNWGKGKRMLIDYSSPNIAKQFSVGHLRSTIIGQAIYNLYKFSGWECIGDNHLGDWGTQFGMIIAAVEKWDLDLSKMTVSEIEKIYVKYNRLVKGDKKYLQKAQEAFARLEKGERKARKIWRIAVEASLKDFNKIYDLLGVKIDKAYGESFYEEIMPEVVKEMKEKGVAVVGEGGALVVEFDNLPTIMLTKSDGSSTYFTRDMAAIKYRQENPNLASDLYVYEVGAEQSLYFKQLFLSVEKMGWGKRKDFVHVAHGLILGEDGKKMSTRKGTTESMGELLKQMIKKAGGKNKQSAKQVGIGAVIFNDLKHAPETSYRFSWERALSMEGDSGPYVQYAVVRARSVLKLAGFTSEQIFGGLSFGEKPLGDFELAVLRKLYRFEEIVERSAREFSPNVLCEYLLELARRFNGFYGSCKILVDAASGEPLAGHRPRSHFRLKLTAAVAQVLENGLRLLNIEVPAKM